MAHFTPVEITIKDLPKAVEVAVPEGTGSLEEVIQSLKSDIIYSTKYLLEETETLPEIKVEAKELKNNTYELTITSAA